MMELELSKELEEKEPDLDKVYEFSATVTYSIYYNQQTSYGIYEFTTDDKLPYTNDYLYKDKSKYLGCLSGNMQELYCETDYKVIAKLKYNKKYKKYDYFIESIFSEQPKTPNEQRKFLEVLCTKRQADIILESYPNIIEDVMTGKHIDTSKFKGIGDKTFQPIKDKILENYIIQDIVVLLRPLGVTFNTIKKMLGVEDNPSLLKQKIMENPYILTSVHGLGFKKVDELALKLNPDLKSSLQRTKAFLFYIFKEIASSEGHTWISKRDLIGYVRKDLRECIDIYKDFIEQETENPMLLYIYDEKIGLLKYYNTAKNIVESLFWLDSLESMIEHFTEDEMDESIKQTEKELGFEFTLEQKEAIKSINEHNVIIVTAPAGAGKSVSIKGIFDLLTRAKVKDKFISSEYNQIHSEDIMGNDEFSTSNELCQGLYGDISVIDDHSVIKVGQSALSAKAAKRMKEASGGQQAMTMHRMLGFGGNNGDGGKGGFAFKKDFPMKYHVNVLDEVSLVNKSLINSYINAIRPHSKLVLIFDFAQLPPIGSGDFTRDILKSKLCINKFTKVHRQGEKSGILMDANKIRVGINPIEKLEKKIVHGELRDMFYRFETDKEKMRDMAVEAYLKSVEDVGLEEAVIITPRKRKCINSATELNKIIQDKLIPYGVKNLTRWKDGEQCIFKLGAKVMQRKNNYDKDKMVFNGDEGYITDIDKNGFTITFTLENGKKDVIYTNSELDQIELSYANTVHACLTKDTLLLTDLGILELKDLDSNTKNGEVVEFNSNIEVYNGNELEIPSHFINNGLSECKKIITQRGYTITATLDHGLDVLGEDGYIIRKDVKDINSNDILVLKSGTNIYGNNLAIPSEWSKYNLNIRSEIYKKPSILTKEFAKFLGYMVADGTVGEHFIKLTKRYIEVVEDYRDIVNKIFGYYYENIRYRYGEESDYKGSDYIYEVCSKDIVGFCKNIDGIQPHDKYVPSIIMQAPKEFQIEFLKSIFEDGTILLKKEKYDQFEICMKNKKLTYQIQAILLNMGVISSVSYKENKDYYRLYIYKNEMKILCNHGFRFISDFKNKRLELINQKYKRSDRKSIQYITKIIDNLIKRYNITKINPNIYLSVREGQITHFMLDRFLEQTKNILQNDTDYLYLKQFCQGVFVDTINEINNVCEETYCLTMPKSHKFLQNGFMGWNCQGSQFHSVICVFDSSSFIMLNRKILYTAITRARKKCMLISEPRAFKVCLDDENNKPRNTFLSEMFENYEIGTDY